MPPEFSQLLGSPDAPLCDSNKTIQALGYGLIPPTDF
jgi:hypothetical protein